MTPPITSETELETIDSTDGIDKVEENNSNIVYTRANNQQNREDILEICSKTKLFCLSPLLSKKICVGHE
jgi:hypothetical protein